MENQEVKRYRAYMGIITYIILFMIFGSIITLSVAKIVSHDTIYTANDIVKANTKDSDTLLKDLLCKTNVISNTISYLACAIGLAIVMLIFLKEDLSGFKSNLKRNLIIILLLGSVFAVISQLLDLFLVHVIKANSENQALLEMIFSKPKYIPAMLLSTVVLAPVVEELVYRKAIFTVLGRFKAFVPILASAAIFAIVHMSSTNFGYQWFVIYGAYLICGLMIAGIYKFSGENIYVSIICHMLNNLVACLIIIMA